MRVSALTFEHEVGRTLREMEEGEYESQRECHVDQCHDEVARVISHAHRHHLACGESGGGAERLKLL